MATHCTTQSLSSLGHPLEGPNCYTKNRAERRPFILDIGGEGRYPEAWNLNPSAVITLGKERDQPIPSRIEGRAEAIPLPDKSVDKIIVERSPLRMAALHEIALVIARGGTIVLRHALHPKYDPHFLAKEILPGTVTSRTLRIGSQELQETTFFLLPPFRSPRINNSARASLIGVADRGATTPPSGPPACTIDMSGEE